ncbi:MULTISPECIES: DUF930 domain-containing protein [unclassified Mesorhizobium]|uniref:DUF930 domain-containing protein n=1 Tax=unclassified Mesorhizobium TaxID=325217 RepID=UPI000F74C363|nr:MULTISPECIES: DUF930 domain-containing protein [unclassified Mesorhizobium]AZO52759.1 DUF930 domain-containing protein [Mesorhizobium sp. M8A.F.Ca.ET.057.01.1.1]RWE45572.1 MAG: DUF930 domain-containing protein [Mesorhizobium sp.]
MKDEVRERRRNLLWGVPASLILHVLIAAILIYGLPIPPQQPREEQPVNVALVPPPDQPKPKPVPPPPEPKVEKPPEQKVEKQPPSEKPPPVEVLKPVFQFGDKDTGPRKSLDGASAQDSSPSPAKDDPSKPPVEPKPAENQPAAPPDSDPAKADEKPADSKPTPDAQKQAASTEDVDKQQAAKQEAEKQAGLDAAKQQGAIPTPLATDGEIELPTSAEAPKPKPANAPKPEVSKSAPQRASGLPGVRKLFSQGATDDALATTSMGGLPRSQRGAKLCASVLQQQLLDASYFPDLIPSIPLRAGNVVDGSDVAFRTTTTWYHLDFRCEVDTNATRVLSFNFRVGPVIPRDQWARLRLY